MEITACPICGSKNIVMGTLGDGIISGLSSWKEVCRDCGYQGASLLFESETEYKKFVEALSRQKKQKESQSKETSEENQQEESNEQMKENKEILKFLEETPKPSRCYEKKNYFFELILSVALSIVFFILLLGSSYIGENNGVFFQLDLFALLLFLLGSFVAILIFFFLFIIFLEMIYRSIRNKKL